MQVSKEDLIDAILHLQLSAQLKAGKSLNKKGIMYSFDSNKTLIACEKGGDISTFISKDLVEWRRLPSKTCWIDSLDELFVKSKKVNVQKVQQVKLEVTEDLPRKFQITRVLEN